MIKAILLPSRKNEAFKPFTFHTPVGLLPVVNKPILEHQVEFLVRHGIQHIKVSCNHLASRIEQYFDAGVQWGASLSYNYERVGGGAVPALQQMRGYFHGATLVIMESDVIADFDLRAALDFHYRNRAEATFICQATSAPSLGLSVELDSLKRIRAVRINGSPAATAHLVDTGVCIIEPEMLDLLFESAGYSMLQSCWLSSLKVRLNLYGYQTQEPLAQATSWKSYYKVQSDILEGKFPNLVIPGIEVEKGVWVGKNVSTSSGVLFEGPSLIGDNCKFGKNVRIGKGTIIGSDVVVDSDSLMQRTIVLSKTLISGHASIKDSIILGNLQIDIHRNSSTAMRDVVAIPKMKQRDIAVRIYHMLNKIAAVFLAIVLSPVCVGAMLWGICMWRGPFVSRVRRLGVDLTELSRGALKLRVFDLYYLGPVATAPQGVDSPYDPPTKLPRSIARLGNLINIINGDILFVGNPPMDPEFAFTLSEEWQRTRFKCQAGMFSVLDTKRGTAMTNEQKSITEAQYAVHRTIGSDLKIMLKVGKQTAMHLIGLAPQKKKKERLQSPFA